MLGCLKKDILNFETLQATGGKQAKKIVPVVFSPGATSFGMFKNEFDRGNQFKKNVKDRL